MVVIADRDRIDSSLEAREIVAREHLEFETVSGLLVTRTEGPIPALWVEAPIDARQSSAATIAAIHDASALAIIVHPFAHWQRSINRRMLERLLANDDTATHPDAIQLTSGSARASSGRQLALELNATGFHLAEVCASNAVFTERVGSAYTIFRHALLPGSRAGEQGVAQRYTVRHLGWHRVAEQHSREAGFVSRRTFAPLLGRFASGGSR